ncbi:MAG: prepilin-type N-terminal cleavage/methylation domain-containing protein [Nitrospirae bacterium]|nr:prepilin-type N-terminal cleavage/methylation domain-containing protein [Nitrospirota bacterium]
MVKNNTSKKTVHCSLFTVHSSPYRARTGFTLVEVVVAIAILAITLVTIMQLFSGGLRASSTSCYYTRAIVHAKDKMEELLVKPVSGSGSFGDGFNWESTIEPYKQPEDSQFTLLNVTVRISWYKTQDQQDSFEMQSMKTISKDENEQ